MILQKKHLSIDDQRKSFKKVAPECSWRVVVDNMADGEDSPLVDTITDESIQQEDIEPETECEEKLQSWLQKISLEGYFNKMKECGLTSVSHLQDIHTQDDCRTLE